MKLSTVIKSQNSWGSKQALNVLGMKMTKTNSSQAEVLDLYLNNLLDQTCSLGIFKDAFVQVLAKASPCFNREAAKSILRNTWFLVKEELKNNPEEFQVAKELLIQMEKEFVHDSNGRQIFLTSFKDLLFKALEV